MQNNAPVISINKLFDPVLIIDAVNGQIISANSAAFEFFGIHKGLLPLTLSTYFPSIEDQVFWSAKSEIIKSTDFPLIDSETMVLDKNGENCLVRRCVWWLDENRYQVLIRIQSSSNHSLQHIQLQKAEMSSAFDSSIHLTAILDLHGNLLHSNLAFNSWLGQDVSAQSATQLSGLINTKVIDPALYELDQWILAARLHPQQIELKLKDGSTFKQTLAPRFNNNRAIGYLLTLEDITLHVEQDAYQRLAWSALEATDEGVVILDEAFASIAYNPIANALNNQSHDFEADSLETLFAYAQATQQLLIKQTIAKKGLWHQTIRQRTRSGNIQSFKVRILPVSHPNSAAHYVLFFKDLNAVSASEMVTQDRNRHLDPLTLLSDRAGFMQTLSELTRQADNTTKFAVVYLDLDFFKHVNESFGLSIGDKAIQEVSARLSQCIRPGDIVARQSGDEFILLLQHVDELQASKVVSRLQDHLFQPYTIEKETFSLTASLGISLYPDNGKHAAELIRNAERAMHFVKNRGRAGVRFYQHQMSQSLLSRMKLDHSMRAALKAEEFFLVYQPQITLGTNDHLSVEALIRWQSPDQGLVSPASFIPLAEETGFIVQIGRWVLDETCKQLAKWRNAGYQIMASVNVSAVQFQQSGFVDEVAEALITHQLPAHALELELTESSLIKDVDEAIKRLRALADLGIRLAIDDFGTGYSNLAYLKQFPINTLKIDRSFIKNVPGQPVDEGLVSAMINMANALDLNIIAEGVETEQQQQFLQNAGCETYQGFLYYPPQSADAISEILLNTQTPSKPLRCTNRS
ncbi:EAL domain-containing protein [Leeia sp. TBRC 13508]|uniref:EAL domain-containing protein n=1 Tax=Leeia speluncae TaxID=2884804 RepID=A0ABS8D8U0_9NEIS|nr:EAL domain-containing protein [Leeia speluncae]MCB6184361.1 EAL domain-containing protein [Leeia speluncae]